MPPSERRQQQCAAQHFGAWCIKRDWLRQAVSEYREGRLPTVEAEPYHETEPLSPLNSEVQNGVMVAHLQGHLTKYRSSFGGTSYLDVQQVVRIARDRADVKSILFVIDSPGGTVAGAYDAADAIAASEKPVDAFISDMGASGAYILASQCRRIWANRNALVGSIGTYTVLTDDSEALKQIGVREVLISSGGVKGLGADGQVTEELEEDTRREVLDLNEQFVESVRRGRVDRGLMTDDQLQSATDGRIHVGEKARELGLIDRVGTLDAFTQMVQQETLDMERDAFMKAASEHKEWLQEAAAPLIESVKQEAAQAESAKVSETETAAQQAERQRCEALTADFGNHPAFLGERIKDGSTPDQAAAKAYREGLGAQTQTPQQQAVNDAARSGSEAVVAAVETSDSDDYQSKIRESARQYAESQNGRGR